MKGGEWKELTPVESNCFDEDEDVATVGCRPEDVDVGEPQDVKGQATLELFPLFLTGGVWGLHGKG